ncbi:MAG TPA: winged helix-turn-helix domain-containing protein [Phycisphaerae bacterium]|nr:winged helix-turn-helix domain-containing protein [Phycisphaerae bacterium]
MDKRRIQIGLVYSVKIGGSWLPARMDKSLGHGRYEAAVLPSGKTVKVSMDAIQGGGETLRRWEARRKPKAVPDIPSEAAGPARPKAADGKKEKQQRKASGLDAAAQVLAEAGGPLNTKEMVERMLSQGLWQTGGKTPAATIYSAILREISVKGDASRFRKVERGKFERVR